VTPAETPTVTPTSKLTGMLWVPLVIRAGQAGRTETLLVVPSQGLPVYLPSVLRSLAPT
jgi:hypothetical protein